METAKLLENILSLFGEQVVVVDARGYIIACSPGWSESITSNGKGEQVCGIGANYLDVCRAVKGPDRVAAEAAEAAIRSILEGRESFRVLEYVCDLPGESVLFLMTVKRVPELRGCAIVAHQRSANVNWKDDPEVISGKIHLQQTIIDKVPAIISYVGADRRYRLVNQRYTEWFGRTQADIEGRTVREVIGDAAYNEVLPEIDAVLSGKTLEFERELKYKDGGDRFVRGSLVPDIDDNGDVCGFFTLLTDETHRHEIEMKLRRSEERFSKMFNSIPLSMTISSLKDHRYVEANEAFLRSMGMQREDVIGRTGRELDFGMAADDQQRFYELLTSDGRVSNFEADFTSPGKPLRTVLLSAVVLQIAGESYLAASGYDITDRKKAEKSLRELTTKLFHVQEEERRRLARELHDTTAQKLSAQLLNLSFLKRLLVKSNPDVIKSLSESIALAEAALGEIRTFSYVLHPPLLDKAGLPSALRWLADGFMKRSGITVEFASAGTETRLPQDLEGAILRIVQEALTNIQRHSESKSAFIFFDQNPKRVHLEVRDEGVGFIGERESNSSMEIDETRGLGVGIMSMRERIRQFGGEMTIWTGPSGTKIIADIPIK